MKGKQRRRKFSSLLSMLLSLALICQNTLPVFAEKDALAEIIQEAEQEEDNAAPHGHVLRRGRSEDRRRSGNGRGR